MKTNLNRPGVVSGTKNQTRNAQPNAGQVFSAFVRNLEQLGKSSRQRPTKPKGKST